MTNEAIKDEAAAEAPAAAAEPELEGMAAVHAAVAKLQDVVDNPANYIMKGEGEGTAATNLWHDVLRDELARIVKNLPSEE
jgi:hypothetical protein